jgi:hypothetical protein
MGEAKVLLAVCLLLSGIAEARMVTWTLQDMEFSDGSTATGSFTFDHDSPLFLSDFDIVTTTGALPATHYTRATLTSFFVSRSEVMLTSGASVLDLWVSGELFDANSEPTVPRVPLILNNSVMSPVSSEHDVSGTPTRLLITGSIAPIPEPASYALLGVGILAVLLMRSPFGRGKCLPRLPEDQVGRRAGSDPAER